jgi:mannose PTS system EIIA component
MAGVLIIAHAPLASALRAVASHVYGERADRVQALDVSEGQSPAAIADAARQQLAALGQREVLVMTDVLGATPSNAAAALADGGGAVVPVQGAAEPAAAEQRPVEVAVVAGVNVPMLWRVLCYLDEPLPALVDRALAGAANGVVKVPPPDGSPPAKAPGRC